MVRESSSRETLYSPDILKTLNEGTTLIVDRYAYSGAVFTAAKVKERRIKTTRITREIIQK
jgi:thymidylate kinase